MTPDEFKAAVAVLLKDQPSKVWLTKVTAHRLDVLWSVGPAQTTHEHTVANAPPYHLIGQSVPEQILPQIVALFERFCHSEEARDAEAESKAIHVTGLLLKPKRRRYFGHFGH